MTLLEDAIGNSQSRTEVIGKRQAELLAVTLGKKVPGEGDALPSCWHWAWFNDALPAAQLGRDGHPKRGGFIPDIPLPRRMWAGGELEFLAPLKIGLETQKRSTIEAIKTRKGGSGELYIVTIGHQLSQGDVLCVNEKQNLVFREDPAPGAPKPDPIVPPQAPDLSEEMLADPVLMFRYSALTFNGHRIHYDVDYARDVEGYPDLVFHAPLTATSLCDIATRLMNEAPVRSFSYRATAPLFCNSPIKLSAKKNGAGVTAWAETPEGHQAMIASING